MGGPGDACRSRRRLSARPACRSRARQGWAVVMHQRGRGHSAPRLPSCWHSGCSPGSHSLTERPSARPRPTCRVPAEEETGDGAWVAAHHDTRSAGAAQLREASFEEKEGLRKLDTWDPPHGVVVSERSALLLSQQRVDRNSGLALSPNLTARSQPPRQTGSVPGVPGPAMGTGGARTHCSRPRHSRPNAPDAGPLSTSAPAHVGVGAERVHVSPSPTSHWAVFSQWDNVVQESRGHRISGTSVLVETGPQALLRRDPGTMLQTASRIRVLSSHPALPGAMGKGWTDRGDAHGHHPTCPRLRPADGHLLLGPSAALPPQLPSAHSSHGLAHSPAHSRVRPQPLPPPPASRGRRGLWATMWDLKPPHRVTKPPM